LGRDLPFFAGEDFYGGFYGKKNYRSGRKTAFAADYTAQPAAPVRHVRLDGARAVPPACGSGDLSFHERRGHAALPVHLQMETARLSRFQFRFHLSGSRGYRHRGYDLCRRAKRIHLLRPVFHDSRAPCKEDRDFMD